ncbi:hypothetical protein NPIL_160151 [Nephila pilipes]|uniref:Uncharacterized protein n=1 Tax=Nephila pilipes TaxID=299642 RepID=A0A8X6NY74_NEPPI|nr:hypothetical protein NPIL_160151 [Nephila pilipes]
MSSNARISGSSLDSNQRPPFRIMPRNQNFKISMGKTYHMKRRRSRRLMDKEESPNRFNGPLTRSDTVVHRIIDEYALDKNIIEKPDVKYQVMIGLSGKPRRIITRSMLSLLETHKHKKINENLFRVPYDSCPKQSAYKSRIQTKRKQPNNMDSSVKEIVPETPCSMKQNIVNLQGQEENFNEIEKENQLTSKQNNDLPFKSTVHNYLRRSAIRRSKQEKTENHEANLKNSRRSSAESKGIKTISSKSTQISARIPSTPYPSRSSATKQNIVGENGHTGQVNIRSILKYENRKNETQNNAENNKNFSVNNENDKPSNFSFRKRNNNDQKDQVEHHYASQRRASKLNNEVEEKQDLSPNNVSSFVLSPSYSNLAYSHTGSKLNHINTQDNTKSNNWMGEALSSVSSFLIQHLLFRN